MNIFFVRFPDKNRKKRVGEGLCFTLDNPLSDCQVESIYISIIHFFEIPILWLFLWEKYFFSGNTAMWFNISEKYFFDQYSVTML